VTRIQLHPIQQVSCGFVYLFIKFDKEHILLENKCERSKRIEQKTSLLRIKNNNTRTKLPR